MALLFLAGCQGEGSPSIPGTPGDQSLPAAQDSPGHSLYGWSGGHHLITLVQVRIDAESRTIDVSPMRTAGQHLNLLQLIPIYCKPATSCLDFINLTIDEETATCELDVVVKHPIPDASTDVYDLRGIGIFKGTLDPGFTEGEVATQITNADGFTTAYDETEVFDAFLNPYIAFNKDLPKRVFEHVSTTQEHFVCQFPSLNPEDAQFLYALDASWADPSLINPDDPTTDPNLPEPYQVNILYTDPLANEFLSEGTAVVEVYDWQKNAAGTDFECPDIIGGSFNMTEVYSSEGRYLYYMNFVNDLEPDPGVYPFIVKAKDEFESQPDLINPTVQISLVGYQLGSLTVYDTALNHAPTASVVADDLFIEAGDWVHFDASASSDPEDTTVGTYAWDLDGDGAFDDGVDAQVDYQYPAEGLYPVNVKVTDSGDLTDILDLPLIVHVGASTNLPPEAAAFASNYNPTKGQIVTLNASNSTDPEDVKPVSWDWDTDNDNIYDDLSGEIVQTSWPTGGVYNVDVKVTDSKGATDTLDTKLVITVEDTSNTPPVAVAEADKMTAAVGETVTFDGSGSYDAEDGEITQFAWDFVGDHSYDDAFQAVVPHKFWAPGTYSVDLKVTDSGGLTDTLDTPLEIEITGPPNQPPVAIAHASDTLVYVKESITFDASASYDPEEGSVSIYQWDLDGDGFYVDAFGAVVQYSYLMPGEYDVNVRVTDTPGLSDTLDNPIHIAVMEGSNTPPVAVAKADKTYIFEGDTVHFDGSGSYDEEDGAPTSWGWEFDGDNDYKDSPFIVAAYTYSTAGTYQADLKVTDKDGAWDTLDVPITIIVVPVGTNFPPQAIGEVNCAFPDVGEAVHFTNDSFDPDGTIVKWEWDFGDTTGWHDFTSTQGDAWHSFDEEGIYEVQLRVTDNVGGIGLLAAPLTVLVSMPGYLPPTDNPSCGTHAMTHMYGASLVLSHPNTNTDSRDLAFLPDGSYLMVVADALYKVIMPSILVEPAVMYNAAWIKSIDISPAGLVALSGLSDGIVKVYSASTGGGPVVLDPVANIDAGEPVMAVAFTETGNLWVYTESELTRYDSPTFLFNACDVQYVPEIPGYGTVDEMDYSPWNHSIYIAINDGANGTVVEVDYSGEIAGVVDNVLLGTSRYLDILVDKNTLKPEDPACRIEVFGGTSQAYVTRLNADMEILSQTNYGFWGIRAAALTPLSSNEVLVLEDCCLSWVDFLMPSADWSDEEK
jgi:PKD repeat protein